MFGQTHEPYALGAKRDLRRYVGQRSVLGVAAATATPTVTSGGGRRGAAGTGQQRGRRSADPTPASARNPDIQNRGKALGGWDTSY